MSKHIHLLDKKLVLIRNFMVLLSFIILASETIAQGESKESSLDPSPANPYLNPYEAISYPERLEVFRDGKQICVVRIERPGIERWGFIDSGNHIVTRSSSDIGPVIIELFDTATCTQVDKLVMTGDQKRSPSWAAGFIN